jgi:hypothetical protein
VAKVELWLPGSAVIVGLTGAGSGERCICGLNGVPSEELGVLIGRGIELSVVPGVLGTQR